MAYGGQQISAYPSQAKTTLTKYAGGRDFIRKPSHCWGCDKEDHPRCKGKRPILCAMKDDPAAIKRADENHKKYIAKQCQCGARSPCDKSANEDQPTDIGKRQFIEYKDMTDGQKTKLAK